MAQPQRHRQLRPTRLLLALPPPIARLKVDVRRERSANPHGVRRTRRHIATLCRALRLRRRQHEEDAARAELVLRRSIRIRRARTHSRPLHFHFHLIRSPFARRKWFTGRRFRRLALRLLRSPLDSGHRWLLSVPGPPLLFQEISSGLHLISLHYLEAQLSAHLVHRVYRYLQLVPQGTRPLSTCQFQFRFTAPQLHLDSYEYHRHRLRTGVRFFNASIVSLDCNFILFHSSSCPVLSH